MPSIPVITNLPSMSLKTKGMQDKPNSMTILVAARDGAKDRFPLLSLSDAHQVIVQLGLIRPFHYLPLRP